jgi:serine/threonine protein kinase
MASRLRILDTHFIGAVLAYCHANMIVHRDMKPGNIFIDDYDRPKLADFGISTFVNGTADPPTASTLGFLPPEVLRRDFRWSFEADIWALGVTFGCLLGGRMPWPVERGVIEVRKAISAGVYTIDRILPADINLFIAAMLDIRPQKRPTAEELSDLPLFKERVAIGDGPRPHVRRCSMPAWKAAEKMWSWASGGLLKRQCRTLGATRRRSRHKIFPRSL